ncbi:MAG: hypothetical protein DWQ34_12755 [Planctomycetota bacterium]|nr:MAG: hypothetical protein DWQ29_05255 [Planctomycetota bacterium]REJ92534.1 MAG: hypothetical protein DWQ34_12755 [Planctomycetota bacterium]REK24112.1 MAG: hypothetical protein DWQ41_13765 [Planctomycetota bacterium]REK38310.1 MAG: hypothetical protein DWQ45_04880 [Planctomycetota bacterium]
MTARMLTILTITIVGAGVVFAAEPRLELSVDRADGRVAIACGDQILATYVYVDDEISRPYFCDVCTPAGVQVTRNHPPEEGDLLDHATFHPGIWMAFGDLSGHDSWRLKAAVRHVEFVREPAAGDGVASFSVRNRYLTEDGDSTICEEVCRYEIELLVDAWLLRWDSRFSSDREFVFGDQEEMGLGARLATPIAENQAQGGLLTDAEGRTTAGEIWSRQAAWCDYSGAIEGHRVGITIIPHPENFRASWWHARNYGFFAANPFGRNAFTRKEKSRVVVAPGEEFRLRFGVVIHDGRPGAGFDADAAAGRYVSE